MNFKIPTPQLQIDFSFLLAQIKSLYLQDALSKTISEINISEIDCELAKFVPQDKLNALAQNGLRGELVFATPIVLKRNPYLLGYYRLLLGFSQKAFYTTQTGVSIFKSMEEKGSISKSALTGLFSLCEALIENGCILVEGVGIERISRNFLNELTLLSLGPQLRGGANVLIGSKAIVKVFEIIHGIVKKAALKSAPTRIVLNNAAGRKVFIEFGPDPDIIIKEEMSKNNYRNIIAIEIKGGTDFSNIHNRLGEAEKSHQKARNFGFVECWTVVNVDRLDFDMAKKESPSTNIFYRLTQLEVAKSKEYNDFKNRIISLTGIPNNY